MIGLEHYLIVSAILFSVGLYGVLSRRSVVVMLMAIEIMFNAVNIALVAMSKFVVPAALRDPATAGTIEETETLVQTVLTGQVFAVFIITVAAAEIALGMAIVIAVYRSRQTVDVSEMSLMRR